MAGSAAPASCVKRTCSRIAVASSPTACLQHDRFENRRRQPLPFQTPIRRHVCFEIDVVLRTKAPPAPFPRKTDQTDVAWLQQRACRGRFQREPSRQPAPDQTRIQCRQSGNQAVSRQDDDVRVGRVRDQGKHECAPSRLTAIQPVPQRKCRLIPVMTVRHEKPRRGDDVRRFLESQARSRFA